MSSQQRFVESDGPISRYDYDDTVVFAIDLGSASDAHVDVVDGTVMLVVGDQQYEFEVPEGDAEAFIKNGVVTVEVRQ
ncbi:DUF7127 family protein [Halomarina litorea]|uniref:DUF7127 family protein n=1 Tax=Halomarina litorea TaxID=2961595 RepID=UPI0020C22A90|nr:hypothetical protein [Halomarina sp. BCD28]